MLSKLEQLKKEFSQGHTLNYEDVDWLILEIERLQNGIKTCLAENAHLADGEDCTLIGLKRLIDNP